MIKALMFRRELLPPSSRQQIQHSLLQDVQISSKPKKESFSLIIFLHIYVNSVKTAALIKQVPIIWRQEIGKPTVNMQNLEEILFPLFLS